MVPVTTRLDQVLPKPRHPFAPAPEPLFGPSGYMQDGSYWAVKGREEVSFPSCAVLFLCYNSKAWLAVCKIPINMPKHCTPNPTAPAA